MMHRKSEDEKQQIVALFNFSDGELIFTLPEYSKTWTILINSTEQKWLSESGKIHPSQRELPLNSEAGDKITVPSFSIVAYKSYSKL